MAPFALTDVDIYADGLDLSCFSNQVSVQPQAVELDATTFCDGGWDRRIAGRRSFALTAQGPQDVAAATSFSAATTSLTYSSGIATATFAAPHGLAAGTRVFLSAYTASGWNGEYIIQTVPSTTTFTFMQPTTLSNASVQGVVQAFVGLDAILGVALGSTQVISTVPIGGTEGNAAYFTQAKLFGYTPLDGEVGVLAPFQANWGGVGTPLVRGAVTSIQTVTATGNGTGFQLGAVSAAQKVYAAAHVLTAGGTSPNITFKLQSDDNSGFSSPTDRITFTAMTAIGGQFSSLAGAITDDWWRIVWTVTGTNPVLRVRALVGVQ